MAQELTCLRYFLLGGAIIVGVCGILESICASYFIYQFYEYSPLTHNNVCGSAIILVVMGLIASLIAWCTWQFLDFTFKGQVVIFSIMLIIVTILNTSAGIWALVRYEQVDLLPVAHLKRMFENAVSSDKDLWDRMQSKLHCCGINGPTDYRSQNAVPWSCCNTMLLASSEDDKSVCTTMYAHGCQHVVMNRTKSILLHIFLLALCTVLLQVCFIMCMSCYVRARRERIERRKELMIAARSLARASTDLETDDNFNQQKQYSKAMTDI